MKSIVTTETSQTPDPTPTQRNLGRILLRNTLAVISGDVAIRLLNVLFTIVTVRLLGDVGLGQYAMTIAFVGLFGVFFELGLTQYFERTIAQNPASTQSLFWNLVALRLMLAVGGVVVISGLAVLWGHEPSVVTAIILFSLTFLLSAFLSPLTTLFTANERFDISTGMQVVNQLITIVLGTVLLWLGFGFLALIYTGFVAMPIQILISIWAIRRYQLGPLPFQIAPASWGTFIKASIPFGITSLALTFNFNADTVILSFFRGAEEVGWYNAAYRMV
nr:oligosaccharide flippase family protein [Chloroflexaceae bacterium]